MWSGSATSLKQAAADLDFVPAKLLAGALEAILEQAQLIKGLAQVHVRVETGSLRDSGRVERAGQGKHWAKVSVRFGGYVVNPKTGKLVNYARIIEVRFPYLKPAADEVQPQTAAVIRRYCLASVKSVEAHGVLRFR